MVDCGHFLSGQVLALINSMSGSIEDGERGERGEDVQAGDRGARDEQSGRLCWQLSCHEILNCVKFRRFVSFDMDGV